MSTEPSYRKCREMEEWELNRARYRPDKSGFKATRGGLPNPLHTYKEGSVPRVRDLDMSIQAERVGRRAP